MTELNEKAVRKWLEEAADRRNTKSVRYEPNELLGRLGAKVRNEVSEKCKFGPFALGPTTGREKVILRPPKPIEEKNDISNVNFVRYRQQWPRNNWKWEPSQSSGLNSHETSDEPILKIDAASD